MTLHISTEGTCEAAFLALKNWLVIAPMLGYADCTVAFFAEIVETHAGLGVYHMLDLLYLLLNVCGLASLIWSFTM